MTSKAALLVIDLQEDFCEPKGALAVRDGRSIAKAINHLLTMPFALKLATRDYHPANHISFASQHANAQPFTSQHTIRNPQNAQEKQTTVLWPDHCVRDTPGCELIPELDRSRLDLVIDKGQDSRVESYSGFGPPFVSPKVSMTGLEDVLKKADVSTVFVVGLAWDYCVKHTAMDAAKAGFKTFVIEDATKAVDQSEEAIAATSKELQGAGVHLTGMDSEELKTALGR